MAQPASGINEARESEVITMLNSNDVLFGRGSGPNDHEGNIRFRALVSERKAEYMATNHRQTKAKIARDIVNTVLSKNGRFLKKVETTEAKHLGIPKGVDAWCVVDDETIMEKAKQALRQQRDKGKSRSPTRTPILEHAKQPAAATIPVRVESYAVSPDAAAYGMPPPDLVQTKQMAAGSSMGTAYSQTPLAMHPNPYEPIPIGGGMNPGDQQLDWNQYAASAIAAQSPNFQEFDPQVEIAAPPSRGGGIPEHEIPRSRIAEFEDRRQSFQVTDLMDSFNKMKTKEMDGEDPRSHYESMETVGTIGTISSMRHNESTDTMGTIEPLPMPGSSKEGTLSLTSSTLSFIKGALGDSSRNEVRTESGVLPESASRGADPARAGVVRPGKRSETRQSINIEDKDFFVPLSRRGRSADISNMSMSFSQVLDNGKRGATDGSEDRDSRGTKKLADDPRPVILMEDEPDNMSTLGKSSMSILNLAMGEDSGILTAASESIFSDIGD